MTTTTKNPPRFWIVAAPVAAGTHGAQTQLSIAFDNRKPSNAVAGPFSTHANAVTWLRQSRNFQVSPGVLNRISTGERVAGDIANPAQGALDLVGAGAKAASRIVQGWFGGLGGMIASGIEGGVIQTFKDIWDVIIGPLEVILGFIVAAFVLVVYFKDDLVEGLKLAGSLASVGALAA